MGIAIKNFAFSVRALSAASRFLILVAGSVAATCSFWSEAAEPATALSNAVEHARAILQKEFAPKVPGVSVAVAIDGRIVWSEGFGFSDLAAKKPVTPATRFRIGSVSKSLTSVGLALLVERGQVDLDAPVQKYVPDFPNHEKPITTRLLAGHLAGIRHYNNEQEMLLNQSFTNAHDALGIFRNDPLVAVPGSKYSYSTYGWTLISAVMEEAAHQDFCRYMDQNVIQPLKMTHTRPDYKGVVDPDCTQFYQDDAAGRFVVAPTVDNSYKWAGGGYLSTPEDLVRFGSALLKPGFLKADSLRLLFTPQKTSDGTTTTYGLGWFIFQDAQGHRILWHTGGSVGGTSVLMLHPETKTVFALACNHSTPSIAKKDRESIVELFAALVAPSQTNSAAIRVISK
jgi:CubicO group peptidase (beta-lactamase class C family)